MGFGLLPLWINPHKSLMRQQGGTHNPRVFRGNAVNQSLINFCEQMFADLGGQGLCRHPRFGHDDQSCGGHIQTVDQTGLPFPSLMMPPRQHHLIQSPRDTLTPLTGDAGGFVQGDQALVFIKDHALQSRPFGPRQGQQGCFLGRRALCPVFPLINAQHIPHNQTIIGGGFAFIAANIF